MARSLEVLATTVAGAAVGAGVLGLLLHATDIVTIGKAVSALGAGSVAGLCLAAATLRNTEHRE